MKSFDNLADARRHHDDMGGFLLNLGGPGHPPNTYMVTQDDGLAYEMRSHLGGADYWAKLAPHYDETR